MTRRDTRQVILDTSLALFNRHGEVNVTTNQIADELDISPGNLHYHFKKKREIVAGLFNTFNSEMAEVLIDPHGRVLELEDLWLYLHLLFETIGRYRFIYRDINDLLERYERLQAPFSRLIARQRQTVTSYCNSLAAAGIMEIDKLGLMALVDHIVMTITFWIPFSDIDPACNESGGDVLARAIYQVISLAIPFIREPERSMARSLALRYVEV